MRMRVTNPAITTLLAFAFAVSIACGSGQDPAEKAQELAKTYVDDNIDALSEQIAGLVIDQNRLAREIGGEVIEDEIHENVKWTYSPATFLRENDYEVVATASLDFDVGVSIAKINVDASLPVDLTVDVDTEQIRPDIDVSRARVDIGR